MSEAFSLLGQFPQVADIWRVTALLIVGFFPSDALALPIGEAVEAIADRLRTFCLL